MAEREVWGFKIGTSPSGKRIWPNALKREATRRLREDGVSPGEVAAELGAHECLVRKWWVADRRERGEKISVEGSAFTQVSVDQRAVPAALPTTAPVNGSTCSAHLYVGGICLQFPLSIDEADLLKLIRVAGQCQ
ncbi:transposase [Thalassorhabdomicrobium marinisediminis]|uniref:transposase n=1 Tax=Thalassorhabdomicrobium marinisediminis TaxID=2170577 RepID=UPI0011B1D539|nr:transposase [Thalassorhabdomicrobium marinisediminis]